MFVRKNTFETGLLCELCLAQGVDEPATDFSSDGQGNTLPVCDDHSTALANRSPESIADNRNDMR